MIERHSRFSASVDIDAPPNVDVCGTVMYTLNPRRVTVTASSETSEQDAVDALRSFLERLGAATAGEGA